MQGAHDVTHHRFRRVVDPAAFALFGIVSRQEGLVEMHNRVAALALLIVAVENPRGVGHGQHFGDVVHTPGQRYGQIPEGDEAEQVAQEADGVGNVVEGGSRG